MQNYAAKLATSRIHCIQRCSFFKFLCFKGKSDISLFNNIVKEFDNPACSLNKRLLCIMTKDPNSMETPFLSNEGKGRVINTLCLLVLCFDL